MFLLPCSFRIEVSVTQRTSPMIQLTGAGKRFGHKDLFMNVDWLITPEDRIGLVGGNGTGKTTLLKILGGYESLDYGVRLTAKGATFGYLPQDGLSMTGRTVFAECLSVFDDLKAMEVEMESLTRRMSDLDHASQEFADVADRFQRLEGEFRMRDGYSVESQVGAVLTGLGFHKDDWHRLTDEFSGGWQMRIALGKLLLERPNLLLLDEPTNHLDLEARNWLEDYLRTYPFAFVLISHDRYFLDVTVRKTVEIWNKGVHFYSGNYEKYLAQKQQRFEQLEAAQKNQRERIDALEAFINRFRFQATKAKQVQSRIKELDKIERIELPLEEKAIHFKFAQPQPSGRTVVEAQRLAKSYAEKSVLRDVNFVIEKGERIALVGVNGAGKSTLIKLLTSREPATSGTIKLGHQVDVDYFAQDQYKELDTDTRMLDDIERYSPLSTQTELRNLLGCFLFSADDVFKKIGVLSGGERNRYALLRLLLRPSNFLLLDEPTNHLDIRAKDVLLSALSDYTGTVVFVSHDRYFLDKLATRVFEVADGGVNVYPGNYEDYVWRKEQNKAGADASGGTLKQSGGPFKQSGGPFKPFFGLSGEQPSTRSSTAPAQSSASPLKSAVAVDGQQPNAAADSADAPRTRRLNPIKRRQLEVQVRELEEEIARLEAGIAATEEALTSFVNAEEMMRQNALLEQHRADLERVMEEWEECAEALE